MRLASGLLASALSLSVGIVACSSFGIADDPDAAEGGVDAAAPFDAGGFVIVDNQSGATEIVADNEHVIWSFTGGLRAASPVAEAAPVDLSTRTATSLQLDGQRVVFASGDAVYYADVNGDMLDAGARSITAQGTNVSVLGTRFLGDAISFAKDTHLYWCPGGACNASVPRSLDLGDESASLFAGERNGSNLWMVVGDDLRSYETAGFTEQARFPVDGGVRAFAIDTFQAFYAPIQGNVIFARDRRSATDSPSPFATVGDGHPWALALDATNLYVAVLDAGTVLKIDKQTRATTTIASGLREPRALAQTDARLLVLTDGKIISYDKGL